MIRNLCLAAACALCLAAPSSASAYWPYVGYGGYFGGYGLGWGYNPTLYYVPPPPYYAVYPPVYYSSQITARHYGASPFAWYAGMEPITYVGAPDLAAAPQPMMIENPYVKGAKATSTKAAMNAEAQPLKIANPYVASNGR
jgi:hypothetical protein